MKLDKECLEAARRQFCLDIGLPWEEYEKNQKKTVLIQRSVYAPGTMDIFSEGARNYTERNSFFRAIICLGQLFICCDERIYDWVVEQYADCKPEWFCDYKNLRKLDEKLREYGQEIYDTHVYYLPEEGAVSETEEHDWAVEGIRVFSDDYVKKDLWNQEHCCKSIRISETEEMELCFIWYEQDEILRFKENNRFNSAISFWEGQPDMLAVAAVRREYMGENRKDFNQSHMCGMAGISRDGEYLWQIGINVDKDYAGQGLGHKLVRALKEEVLRRGKVPFYGTGESHTLSQTVGLKAGFVPAWTEVSARKEQ